MNTRRRFLLAAGALLATSAARAQPAARHHVIGAIVPFSSLGGSHYLDALREQLAAHGFVEGRNLTLEVRSTIGRAAAQQHARELLELKADALFTLSTLVTLGAQDATQSVPIVFAWVADPVLSGIVKDYARPGGNTTGASNRFFELTVKRLELLRELVPGVKRVAVLAGYFDPTLEAAMRLVAPAATQLGLTLEQVEAGPFAWTQAIDRAATSGAHAVLVLTPFANFGMAEQAGQTVRAALRNRIPVVYADIESVSLGGLASYGVDSTADVRRGADYLARVLKGEKPGEMPVDQVARFELAVNLKTARAAGIAVPRSILARADRVIE
jgi:putative ABC transport system substrate-binding protein